MNLSIYLHRAKNYLNYLYASQTIHHIHSPFLFEFVKECMDKENLYYAFEELNQLRKKLSENNTEIFYKDIGSQSMTLKKTIRVKDILRTSVSPAKYSELYFRIAQFLKAKNILELGTSLGLNTLYLSKATTGQVISIEGMESMYQFAKKLFKEQRISNIHLIHSFFEDVLPKLAAENLFDLVFIDGNHTYEATIQYYSILSKSMSSLSVIIIDDIYWNPEMTRAWKQIQTDTQIKFSIDLYRCGILIFNPNILYAQHFILRY